MPSRNLRYLGVILDQRLSSAAHIDTVAKKDSSTAASLARLMLNLRGPSQWKRRLLESVAENQLLYAGPVWGKTVSWSARTRDKLIRPQRSIALRVIRGYKTV